MRIFKIPIKILHLTTIISKLISYMECLHKTLFHLPLPLNDKTRINKKKIILQI
jgi:hypothetical protein